MNANNSNNERGSTVVGGAEVEAVNSAAITVGTPGQGNQAGLQNSGLRKSMQGSTAGLRSLQATMNTNNQQIQPQQVQNSIFTQNSNARQSHSHSSHPNAHPVNGQQLSHQTQSQNGHQQAYHSVTAQSRAQQQQMGLYVGGAKPQVTHVVSSSANYGQILANGQVSGQPAANQNQAANAGGVKYQQHGSMMGVGAHNAIMTHKQFSLSSQQGLFPKITNLRIDNQTVPNSAHSNTNNGPATAQGGGQITQSATMNVLKHSGGHISGMSNHQAHQQNLNHPNNHYRGIGVTNGSVGYTNGLGMMAPQQMKPFSSPRSSQQHPNIVQGAPENSLSNSNDPNYVYQQQLQWKTKSTLNGPSQDDPSNQASATSGQVSETTNPSSQQQPAIQSPIPSQNAANAQLLFEQQRAKQMSSGSEKRLKLQQQRQYYSEQYRVQQQRQHQQTANAVLSQNGAANGSQAGQASNASNQFSAVPLGNREPSAALRSTEYAAANGVRAMQSQQPLQSSAITAMTPQLYSQQRQRHQMSMMPTAATMHNTQMINGPIALPNQIQAGQNQIGATSLSNQHANKQKQVMANTMNSSQTYQQNVNQVFFKKRASSNSNSQHQNVLSSPNKIDQQISQPQASVQAESATASLAEPSQPRAEEAEGVSSPKNSQQTMSQQPPQSSLGSQSTTTAAASSSQQQRASTQSTTTATTVATTNGANGAAATQQQTQPKIPVICGFHKRILLITCQGQNQQGQPGALPAGPQGMNGGLGINPNSSMSQARRIRNKNPNCNHNSNSVFYQPHYNNVKYDDSHKKKEDVLRKVFFKECAKEEEKRLFNGSSMFPNGQYPGQGAPGPNGIFAGPSEMARQQAFSQANDPNKHLQIIERILCEYLFVSQPFDRSQKQSLSNTQSLMMELGLDRALTPHRAFLLALIRAGKFNADNMLKVLSEVKTSATEFDNECIYCKYSQYALKESAKLLQKHQAALAEQSQTNPQQALAQQQQIQANGGIIKGPSGEDIRIENLVRMFQSQLFKKSFINTSLMIIQRKMTEKYFQKYHNAKQAQQAAANGQDARGANGQAVQYGPDGKPIEATRRPAKNKPKKNPQNLTSLEYLSKEIQKLAKNLANPKDKERYLELKEKYYREFLIKILKSNGVEKIQFPNASFTPYKYYIGRGNNSGIVRTALKSRFWWSMGDYDDWEDYNFIWTQWKSNKILNSVKNWKDVEEKEQKEQDKKRSSQSNRAGGHIDSQLSTQATDKESTSSKENLITTPKKNKLASASLGNTNSELAFKKQNSATANSSAMKAGKVLGRGKKGDKQEEEEKEENHTSHHMLSYAKMENNYHLSNKKAIYYNMKVYYEAIGKDYFNSLPLTFHIKEGLNDPQFIKFETLFADAQDSSKETVLDQLSKFGKNLWIVKPGENTNRGCGIQVSKDLDHIKSLVQNTNVNGNKRSYIIQKYIEKPLLYKNRKFDIRCFTLMSSINGNLQGYWYTDGYLRTSCREFTLKNVSNRYVHLTNDAVQKKLDDYGKFESGNKLSYAEFQKYLDSVNIKTDFIKDVVPKMKSMAQDSMRAVSRKIDPDRKAYSCEIFGYDFMIDEDMNVWMIEVNTNPCFELSSPYLARLIPAMIENALKIAVDPVFPPPPVPNSKKHHALPDAQDNKFELIFNEREDAADLKNLPIDDNMNGIIEEEEMEEEGSDIEEEENCCVE